MAGKLNKIISALESGSKKITDEGAKIAEKTGVKQTITNGKTVLQNAGKWGLGTAVLGAGVGTGIYATSMGVGGALEKVSSSTTNAVKSLGGIIIVGLLVALCVVGIKKWSNKT